MAEIAAGAIVAEQVVATAVEATAVAAVARPTLPLKATFSQVKVTSSAEDSSSVVARSHHTITAIGSRAYIFGGKQEDGQLCSTDIYQVGLPTDNQSNSSWYVCHKATAAAAAATIGEASLPAARYGHAACAYDQFIVIHGGRSAEGPLDSEGSFIWLWDSAKTWWKRVGPASPDDKAPEPRHGHQIFVDAKRDLLILHGGQTTGDEDKSASETWLFKFEEETWTQLPPTPAKSMSSALVNNTLFTISSDLALSGTIHHLKLDASVFNGSTLSWSTIQGVSGPQPRIGSQLVPITTGYGRTYLLQLLGGQKDIIPASEEESQSEETPTLSDVWSLQVPSGSWSSAQVKDVIRDTLPKMDSGSFTWAEVEIVPTELHLSEGKVHPGPRGFFGADTFSDGKHVILWGGLNAKGQVESDGWVIQVK